MRLFWYSCAVARSLSLESNSIFLCFCIVCQICVHEILFILQCIIFVVAIAPATFFSLEISIAVAMCLRAHDFHYISLLNCVSHNSSHILFELFFFGGVSNAFTLLFELFLSAHFFFFRSFCRQFHNCLCISFLFYLLDIG